MAEIFHFENDLYYINEGLSALIQVFDIEVDEAYFFDKIIEDVLFYDSVIGKLSLQLKENPKTLNLDSTYRNLFLTQRRYLEMLEKFINEPESSHLPVGPFKERFRQIADLHEHDNASIQEMFEKPIDDDSPDLVSQEEYQFLFQDESEE